MRAATARPRPEDPTVLDERGEKSAAALVAVARVLAAHRPLGGREDPFLALYAGVVATEPARFTSVWSDPAAYHWVRIAYDLVGACVGGSGLPVLARRACGELGGGDPARALVRHLEGFTRFVLALHLGARATVTLPAPLETRLPLALPASRLTLGGVGVVRITGVRDGALRFGERSAQVAAEDCPVVDMEGRALRLQPAAFDLPGLDLAESLRGAGTDYQRALAPVVDEALGCMRRYQPAVFAAFRARMQLAALKPVERGSFTNLSHSDLAGACIVSEMREPLQLAETLIHELHHTILFHREERGPFLAGAAADVDDCVFYSPWRPDLRSLHGILHATYVALATGRWWLALFVAAAGRCAARDYVVDRAVRVRLQLGLGVAQLRRHARLTARGRALLAEIERDVAALEDACARAGVPDDAPAVSCDHRGTFSAVPDEGGGAPRTVREDVRAHATRGDVDGQIVAARQRLGLL